MTGCPGKLFLVVRLLWVSAAPGGADWPTGPGRDRLPLGDPDFYPSRQRPYGWRGDGSGCFPAATPPLKWNVKTGENVLWRRPLRSYSLYSGVAANTSSPCIAGERIFVTSDPYFLLCLDKRTGRVLWERANDFDILGPEGAGKKYAYQAHCIGSYGFSMPTPVTDGVHVWVVFGHGIVACYDLDGNRKWAGYFQTAWEDHWNGLSQSPCLCGDVLVTGGYVVSAFNGWDAATGKQLWLVPLPRDPKRKMCVGRGSLLSLKVGGVWYALTSDGLLLHAETGRIVQRGICQMGGWGGTQVIADGVGYFVHPVVCATRITPGTDSPMLWKSKEVTETWRSALYRDGWLYLSAGFTEGKREAKLIVLDPKDGRVLANGPTPRWYYSSPTSAGRYIFQFGTPDNLVYPLYKPGTAWGPVARVPNSFSAHGHPDGTMPNCPVFEGTQMFMRDYAAMICIDARLADVKLPAGDLAALTAQCRDPGLFERGKAARALAALGPKAAPAVRALLPLLVDESQVWAAQSALDALVAIGKDEPAKRGAVGSIGGAAMAEIEKGLTDADPAVRAGAAIALSRSADANLGAAAAAALGAAGPVNKGVVPGLAAALGNPNGDVASAAARALARIGPPAEPAISALVAALNHKDRRVHSSAVAALQAIGRPAIDALIGLVGDKNRAVAGAAVTALGRIGAAAAAAVPALIELVKKRHRYLLAGAVQALGGIGPKAAEAVPVLMDAAKDAEGWLPATIREALRRIKTSNKPPQVRDVSAVCIEGLAVAIGLPVTDADDPVSSLKTSIVTQPAHGSAEPNGPLACVYRSQPPFVGTDSFTWQAEDAAGAESAAKVTITVQADTTPPGVVRAGAAGQNDRVAVVFSEPASAEDANKAANYRIDNGVTVKQAALAEGGRSATLITSPLREKVKYAVTVSGVRDLAKAGNVGGGSAAFEYVHLLPGLVCEYYQIEGEVWRELGEFDKLTPKAAPVAETFDLSAAERSRGYAMRFTGLIRVPRDGEYTFCTTSDGGSSLFIDGQRVVDNDGIKNAEERSGKVKLTAGLHPIVVTFFQAGGSASLDVRWSGPGVEKQDIPASVLFHVARLADVWQTNSAGGGR